MMVVLQQTETLTQLIPVTALEILKPQMHKISLTRQYSMQFNSLVKV